MEGACVWMAVRGCRRRSQEPGRGAWLRCCADRAFHQSLGSLFFAVGHEEPPPASYDDLLDWSITLVRRQPITGLTDDFAHRDAGPVRAAFAGSPPIGPHTVLLEGHQDPHTLYQCDGRERSERSLTCRRYSGEAVGSTNGRICSPGWLTASSSPWRGSGTAGGTRWRSE
jgi:hypothetical protein